MNAMKYAIFDLDNCLADDSHRIPLIDWDKPPAARWDRYHDACAGDLPCEMGMAILKNAERRGLVPIFFTGRPERVRAQTTDWIEKHLGVELRARESHSMLFMRLDGDTRHAAELKEWLLEEWRMFGKAPGSIEEAYDDRHDVLAMYRKHGINAFHYQVHSLSAYAPPGKTSEEDQRNEAARTVAIADLPTFAAHIREQAHVPKPIDAASILAGAAETFGKRNAVYKDNYKKVKLLIDVLFPEGVPSHIVHTNHWHLFELVLVKLTRFVNAELSHTDSIHDIVVYAAMIEASILNGEGPQ